MFASLFSSTRTKNDNKNNITLRDTSDTFAETWGATTQWKNSGRRDQQPRSTQNSLDPHLTAASIVGSPLPAPLSRRYGNTDKPLPPLPPEAIEMGMISPLKPSQDPSNTPVQPNTELSKEGSPSNDSTKNDSSGQSRISSSSSVMGGGKRKSFFGIKRKTVKVRSPAAKVPMVDKGTQTTPTIEIPPGIPAQTHSPSLSPHSGSPRSNPNGSFFSSTRGMPSPSAGMTTPLWSPRTLLVGTGPSDYFGFPTDTTQQAAGSLPSSTKSTPKAVGRHHKHKSLPGPRRSSYAEGSTDTLGTYESRYSPRESVVQPTQSRPPLKRQKPSPVKLSDTVVPQKPFPHFQSLIAGNINQEGLADRRSVPENPPAKRPSASKPLLQSLQRISSFRSPSRRHSSTRSESPGKPSPSLLRHELSYSDDDTDIMLHDEPTTPQFFRMPIFGSASLANGSTAPSPKADVPEHFAGSPLCPMHPKHKSGGLGTCPYHGRRKSAADSITGDGEYGREDRRMSDEHHLEREREEEDAFWRDVAGETRKRSTGFKGFELAAVGHQEGSVLCPAHPRYGGIGKGVCVFHGRGRLGKLDSDESVPRLRM